MAYHGWILSLLDDMVAYANEKGLTGVERKLSQLSREIEPELRATSSGNATATLREVNEDREESFN